MILVCRFSTKTLFQTNSNKADSKPLSSNYKAISMLSKIMKFYHFITSRQNTKFKFHVKEIRCHVRCQLTLGNGFLVSDFSLRTDKHRRHETKFKKHRQLPVWCFSYSRPQGLWLDSRRQSCAKGKRSGVENVFLFSVTSTNTAHASKA